MLLFFCLFFVFLKLDHMEVLRLLYLLKAQLKRRNHQVQLLVTKQYINKRDCIVKITTPIKSSPNQICQNQNINLNQNFTCRHRIAKYDSLFINSQFEHHCARILQLVVQHHLGIERSAYNSDRVHSVSYHDHNSLRSI